MEHVHFLWHVIRRDFTTCIIARAPKQGESGRMLISRRIRESRGDQPNVVVLKDSKYAVRLWVAISYPL